MLVCYKVLQDSAEKVFNEDLHVEEIKQYWHP